VDFFVLIPILTRLPRQSWVLNVRGTMKRTILVFNYVLTLPFFIWACSYFQIIPSARTDALFIASLGFALLFSIPQIILCVNSLSDGKNKGASLYGLALGIASLCLIGYVLTHFEMH
jgi:hypothetical protein